MIFNKSFSLFIIIFNINLQKYYIKKKVLKLKEINNLILIRLILITLIIINKKYLNITIQILLTLH
jgi:hypothetical protein